MCRAVADLLPCQVLVCKSHDRCCNTLNLVSVRIESSWHLTQAKARTLPTWCSKPYAHLLPAVPHFNRHLCTLLAESCTISTT